MKSLWIYEQLHAVPAECRWAVRLNIGVQKKTLRSCELVVTKESFNITNVLMTLEVS
jgi:hypothetical protein